MGKLHLVQHAEEDPQAGDPGLTLTGVKQAEAVAEALLGLDVGAVYSSPLQRAVETAEIIAERLGHVVIVDTRLVERVNWDATISHDAFIAEWERSVEERDYQPENGFSSHQAADRLLEFIDEVAGKNPGDVIAVTHGGITVDMLRTVLGDDEVPEHLWNGGVPPGAITTMDGQKVLGIAGPRPPLG